MYGKMKEHLAQTLAEIKEAGLYKNEQSPQQAAIQVAGKEVLNFCANNYLGLSNNPRLIQAAKDAMDKRGFGMSSVRFICGTADIHKELEAAVSDYFKTEDAILYAACFDANGGVFEPLLTEEDAIISDALNHASIIDGVRLCKAKRYRYANADMAELEKCLQEAQAHEITYLVKHGPSYVRYGLGRDTGKAPKLQDDYDSEETMLIMWDPAALDATEKGTFWLSETPDKPGKGWDADYNRNVNWVRFYHKGTGLSFYYFNTHLDNKGSVARTESMKLIAERIKSINKENLPVFLSADFNAKPNNAIFAPIRDWMKSARNEAPESESVKNTFNGYNAPKSQIDHIFFCGDKVSAQTFRVLDGDYGATWISDHYPIVATFNYKK